MAVIKINGYRCERCSHQWVSRTNSVGGRAPIVCPKCKSPYWNVLRKNKVKNREGRNEKE